MSESIYGPSSESFYSPTFDESEEYNIFSDSQFSPNLSLLSIGGRGSCAMRSRGRAMRSRGRGSLAMRSRGRSTFAMRSKPGHKTYVAIFCPSNRDHLLIRVSVDSLLTRMPSLHDPSDLKKQYTHMSCGDPSELTKDFIDLLPAGSIHYWTMRAVCTSSVGALGPCIFLFQSKSSSKEVFRYNLHEPHMRFHKCANMPVRIDNALSVQIGDFFYVLNYHPGGNQPVLQKYDIENDIWTLVKDNIDITRCNYTDQYDLSMSSVPHVVINRKLHVSFGYNSFAFDTEKDIWEYSNLFDKFWSVHKPLDFYGGCAWGMNERTIWKFANKSFGFYGRGIIWDEDILLGVHYSEECQLVAFQLMDNKVVKSQTLTFIDHVFEGVQLVDLGQGYIGLLHVTTSRFRTQLELGCQLELVTIVVSKPLQPRGDCFLECQIVRKDRVAHNFNYNVSNTYKSFSV